MSVFKLYSIYDSAVSNYGPVMVFKTNGEAMRFFIDLASNGESFISKHKSDYTLFELAFYDDVTAVITNHVAPIRLGSAEELSSVS